MKNKKFTKGNYKTTSVTITKDQYKFIKKNNLNFSAIVQDALEKLILIKDKGTT